MTNFNMNGLSLSAPKGYQVRTLVLTAPQEKGSQVPGQMVMKKQSQYDRNVVVVAETVPPQTDAQAFADQQVQVLKQSVPDFQLTQQGVMNVGGMDCPMLEAQSAGPEGRLVQMMLVYAVKGNTAYSLSASNLAGLPYSESKKEYAEIIASFVAA
jgi:hypothetical protein